MGTSNRNLGQSGSTPLVPSWADDEGFDTPLPEDGEGDRFSAARSDYTRFVNSGGTDRSDLYRAATRYIRNTLGGSDNATKRLGRARTSTQLLLGVLSGVAASGLRSTLEHHGFQNLIGKSFPEVLIGLIDYFCPDGGRTDEAIARNAYVNLLESLEVASIDDTNIITEPQLMTIFEIYCADVIKQRLINDIGSKSYIAPKDIRVIEQIETQLDDFIMGAVSDVVVGFSVPFSQITDENVQTIVEDVYRSSYDILAAYGYESGERYE